jgi:hypothetical protein
MTDQTPESPAALLRLAAARLRQHATAPGITPPPWASLDGGDRLLHDGPGSEDQPPQYAVDEPMSNGANAGYIALMHPGVGLALAELLDVEANVADDMRRQSPALTDGELAAWVHGPLAIARVLLGEVTR